MTWLHNTGPKAISNSSNWCLNKSPEFASSQLVDSPGSRMYRTSLKAFLSSHVACCLYCFIQVQQRRCGFCFILSPMLGTNVTYSIWQIYRVEWVYVWAVYWLACQASLKVVSYGTVRTRAPFIIETFGTLRIMGDPYCIAQKHTQDCSTYFRKTAHTKVALKSYVWSLHMRMIVLCRLFIFYRL